MQAKTINSQHLVKCGNDARGACVFIVKTLSVFFRACERKKTLCACNTALLAMSQNATLFVHIYSRALHDDIVITTKEYPEMLKIKQERLDRSDA